MFFDGTATFRFFSWRGAGRVRQDRFDHFVLEDPQSGNRLQSLWRRFVKSTSRFVNKLFATQLLQVIRSLPRLVGPLRISQNLANLLPYLAAPPTPRPTPQHHNPFHPPPHPTLVTF